jgi:hypothetical protein
MNNMSCHTNHCLLGISLIGGIQMREISRVALLID